MAPSSPSGHDGGRSPAPRPRFSAFAMLHRSIRSRWIALALGWIAACGEVEPSGPQLTAPGGAPSSAQASPEQRSELDGVERAREAGPAPEREVVEVQEDPDQPHWAPTVALEEGLLVRVVAEETGEPVPGATAIYCDEEMIDPSEMMLAARQGGDVYSVLQRFGEARRTDAQGEVVVPWAPGKNGVVAARHANSVGFAPIEEDASEPFELVIAPSTDLVALVVDAAGRPVPEANVAVLVGFGDVRMPALQAESDARGEARFLHFSQIAQEMGTGSSQMFVGLACALSEPVEVAIDPDELPAEPVRLQMPPAGAVEIELLDVNGEPVLVSTAVRLGLANPPEGSIDPRERTFVAQGSTRANAVTDNGLALFPYVSVGERFRVDAELVDGSAEASLEFAGPAVAGASVRVELRFDDLRPFVTARAMRSSGEPWSNVPLRARLRMDSSDGSRSASNGLAPLRTEEDGRFRVAIPLENSEWATQFTLELSMQSEGQELESELQLPLVLGAGENDLGELVFEPPPLLVSGRVLGPDGAGVPRARVQVQYERRSGRASEHRYWRGLSGAAAFTDAEGGFELYARHEGDSLLRLQISAEEYRTFEGDPFAPGASGLVLRLSAAGRLRGSVLFDADLPRRGLWARCRLEGNESWIQTSLDDDPEFEWAGLEPGVYAFQLAASALQEPLLEVSGVQVVAGRTTEDARLQEIDLRGQLVPVSILVSAADGEPLERADVRLLDEEGEAESWFNVWRGEPVELLTTADRPLRVSVSAEGYRPELLEGVLEDVEVELRRGIPLTVLVSGGEGLPQGYELWVGLQAVGGSGQQGVQARALDARGEVVLRVSGPGEYRPTVQLFRIEENSRHGRWVDLNGTAAGQAIQVDEGGATHALAVPAERVQTALEQMQG